MKLSDYDKMSPEEKKQALEDLTSGPPTHPNHMDDCELVLKYADEFYHHIPVPIVNAIYRICGELERYDRGLVREYLTGDWPEIKS
jgi:hypothetical protein